MYGMFLLLLVIAFLAIVRPPLASACPDPDA
jgi:hypothetical protein